MPKKQDNQIAVLETSFADCGNLNTTIKQNSAISAELPRNDRKEADKLSSSPLSQVTSDAAASANH